MNTHFNLKHLIEYVSLIKMCEGCLIDKFALDSVPYANQKIVSKEGDINAENIPFSYRFHGSGCRFIINGNIELDYDVYLTLENYIVTSPWKFMRFFETYYKSDTVIVTQADIGNWLDTLLVTGVITKLFPEYAVYSIDLRWWSMNC